MARAKLLVALLAVPGTLLLAEVLARACVTPPEFFGGHPFDAELGFASIPGTRYQCCDERGPFPWVLNSSGFRGPDLPPPGEPAPPGTARLLFVGDSFLEGWNVRDEALLPFSAQAALAERGVAAQSFNLSSSGYGTGQELLVLRRHGARVRPDVVVLCLYSGNDIVDNSLDLAGRTTVSTGAWVRPYFVLDQAGELELSWLHPWRARLRRSSRLFTLLDQRAYHRRYRAEGQYLRAEADRPVEPFARLKRGLVMGADMELFLEPRPGDDWDRAWRTTEALLVEFEREVRSLGAELLVVVIPHVAQVETNALFRQTDAEMLAAGQRSMLEQLDLDLPERRLRALCERHALASVFLLEELRAVTRASGASTYLYDGHLNGRGHARAGAIVGARLAELLAGGAGTPAAAPSGAGRPVDILAELWGARAELRFSEPLEDAIGYGWIGWACNQFGLGPGWAMKQEGWLVLGRGRRYVIEAELPPGARFPVEFRVKNRHRLRARPLVVSAPGPFEIEVDMHLSKPGPEWMPVILQASQAFESPGIEPVGLILKALRRVD